MPSPSFSPESFQTFGDLLKYLRRRERLTQLELSITVGYSEAQIGRLEKNQRLPDLTAVKALFIPALHLENEPELMKHFLDLAESARQEDAPAPGVTPYKGLLFFDESDADLFFGREALTARLAEHVMDLAMDASSRFLAVVGASGSGKSSLVRAGLAVALKRAGWDVRTFTPTGDPLKILEANLNSARTKSAERVLILVDQFEEVFTLCRDEMERIAFIEKLLFSAQDTSKKITVVIALRADFYSHCAQYPLLRRAVSAQQEYIGQMTAEELRRAIEEPAKRGGWELEPGLVDVLLNDIGLKGTSEPEPGALPLLSHALLATWERRRGRMFTLDGYHASGGVRGAIAETAESVFTDQLNQTQQELARDVFLRLTELGEGTEDTRRRAALNELVRQSAEATQLRAVLNTLAEARLITLNEDSAEVAHEALIREWARLHEWLTQDRAGLLLHRHLTESTHEWEVRGRDPAELYRGARLAQAREWASANEERLNAAERAFLKASIEQEQHDALEREAQRQRELEAAQKLAETEKARSDEQASSIKRLRQRGIFLSGALVLALVAAIFANVFARNAQQQALISSVRELSNAANLNLEIDPERSILLALHAVDKTYSTDHTVLPEAEYALRRALQASRVELTLNGHTGPVWNAAFSPDGKRIATASADGTARIWDAITGKELLSVQGSTYGTDTEQGYAWFVAFSPDGKLLATAGGDGVARIWDANTGQQLISLEGHYDQVFTVAFSPDGKRLVTSSNDSTAKVWDVTTGEELLTVREESDDVLVWWATFSPDGAQIATAVTKNFESGWTSIWDVETGEKMMTLPALGPTMRSVAFSPDGARIVTTEDDRTAKLWDASSGKLLMTLYGHAANVTDAKFSLDGTRIVTVSLDRQIKVWDAGTGQDLITLAGHSDGIWSVSFSSDGEHIVTASDDNNAKVWSITPTRELVTFDNGSRPSHPNGVRLVYSPDGTRLATVNSDLTPKVWDVKTEELLFELVGHTDMVTNIVYSLDGTQIATASGDGTAKMWDAISGKDIRSFIGHKNTVFGIDFSPDGSRLATASLDGTATVWDTKTGEALFQLTGHTFWVMSVKYSPDGARLVTGSGDETGIVWDAMTGKKLFSLIGHSDTVRRAIFSPDGARILTASLDGTSKVWDATTGKELLTLVGHADSVFDAAFSRDGIHIATASGDQTAKVWDAVTGEALWTFPTPDGLTGVAFSPDGSQLAVGSLDGTDRIYLLRIEDLVALANERVTRSLTTEECQQYLHIETCPSTP